MMLMTQVDAAMGPVILQVGTTVPEAIPLPGSVLASHLAFIPNNSYRALRYAASAGLMCEQVMQRVV
jgi:hypothetical protein